MKQPRRKILQNTTVAPRLGSAHLPVWLALGLITLPLGGAACSDDCDHPSVEAQLEWNFEGTGERGVAVGTVTPGNVLNYDDIERAILNPGTVTGWLAGMLDNAREGRLQLASFGLPFPLAVGDTISRNRHGGGGWGFLTTSVGEGFEFIRFDPPLDPASETPEVTQGTEVIALSPLRLRVVWVRTVAGTATRLNGEMTLTRHFTRRICN